MSPTTSTLARESVGCNRLIEALDQAVAGQTDFETITCRVRDALVRLINEEGIELPEELRRPAPDSYARRLIHSDPELGYTALSMVWGPGQATPVHDHAGLWCVEGVIQGRIEVTQYRLVESRGTRMRFEPQEPDVAGVGSAGRLIPPYDYHTIGNALPDRPSVTIHIYGGEMDHCKTFHPAEDAGEAEDGWYETVPRSLSLTGS